jgi:hypothetical protein
VEVVFVELASAGFAGSGEEAGVFEQLGIVFLGRRRFAGDVAEGLT